ncbi:hypothetical protein RB195_017234 [Necator americanus]|uniref:Uncharacterized protein n=1 Tax=Necator americanus TaxID=51031 RepID=A0ABR1C5U9_NECAM
MAAPSAPENQERLQTDNVIMEEPPTESDVLTSDNERTLILQLLLQWHHAKDSKPAYCRHRPSTTELPLTAFEYFDDADDDDDVILIFDEFYMMLLFGLSKQNRQTVKVLTVLSFLSFVLISVPNSASLLSRVVEESSVQTIVPVPITVKKKDSSTKFQNFRNIMEQSANALRRNIAFHAV